jgi:predicted aspartyl protease
MGGWRTAYVGAILLAVASPAASQPEEAVDRAENGTRIATQNDLADRITVPVTVNGAGPYDFVVDTGADTTVVSDRLAASLALPPAEGKILSAATSVAPVTMARLKTLEVGGVTRDEIDAAVLEHDNLGGIGIVGVDSLTNRRVVINFAASRMSVATAAEELQARREPDPPGTIVVTAKRRKGQLILTQAYYRGRSVDVVIDTGAELSIGNAAFLRLVEKSGPPEYSVVTGVTGKTAAVQVATIQRIEIGGVTLLTLPAAFADIECFRRFGLLKRPALLLGMNALRQFEQVAIDFRRRRVSFYLSEQAARKPACLIRFGACAGG